MKNYFYLIVFLITANTLAAQSSQLSLRTERNIANQAAAQIKSVNTVLDKGKLNLEFDHVFGSNDLILGQGNTTSQGEILKVEKILYIVSNIVLTREDGTEYIYPKNDSYFIVDETKPKSRVIHLENIPAGDYVKIKFGIGVDKEQFNLGASGQGNFLAEAQASDLIWSWSAGYKYLAFEGTFTSATVSQDTPYMLHTGRTGTDYNYCDVTLDLKSKAVVKSKGAPTIHVIADVSIIVDGVNKIILTEHNDMGMGAMIMGGKTVPLVSANLNEMFHVDHIHNN